MKRDNPEEGARNLALLIGIQLDHVFAYQFCTHNRKESGKLYRGFGTDETIEDAFAKLIGIPAHLRSMFEYLSLQGGTYFTADIEWYLPIPKGWIFDLARIQQLEDDTLKTLRVGIELVLGSLTQFRGREQCTSDSRIEDCNSHETDCIKISLHYKHTGIGFGPIICQLGLWEKIIDSSIDAKLPGFLSAHPQEEGKWSENKPFIDTHIYKKAGCFRSPYCVKLDSRNSKPLTSREHPEFNLVNFISHSVGIHSLRNREKTFQESGLSRQEFDERIPEKHNITFLDTSKWDSKQNEEKNRISTQLARETSKPLTFSLEDLEEDSAIETDITSQSPMYAWIASKFAGKNKGFTIHSVKRKDNMCAIGLRKPSTSSAIICCNGMAHHSNHLSVNIIEQPNQDRHIGTCYCFQCKKSTSWGAVPPSVVQKIQQ